MKHQFEQLRLESVSRSFVNTEGQSVAALQGLDLSIRRGEFIALLGPSGCGKSTALNCIAGLQPLSGGGIWLDDKRIDVLPPEKRGFGMVFQNYALFPHMSVLDNVGFGLKMRGMPKAEATKQSKPLRILDRFTDARDDEEITVPDATRGFPIRLRR